MSWNDVGSYGCPVPDITPNIDRLALQGIQFDYGFVNIAICNPSRQVLLTGSHSHQTMTRGFTAVERVGPALPDVLKDHGYFIAQVNKQQQSYHWDADIGEQDSDFGRNVTRQGALATGILKTAGTKPWFLMYNLNDPHRPFYNSLAEKERFDPTQRQRFSQPSRVYTEDEIVVPGFLPDLPDVRMEMAQYYSSVRRADDAVGALLQALEATGQSNHTIVVFVSDNGVSAPFAKINCYQASLRVPFILRYPGVISAPLRDKVNMISAVDLTPTLLELVGLDAPDTMAGRSFAPLLHKKNQDKRDYVIGYYYRNLGQTRMYPEFVVHMRDWVYVYNPWVDGKTQVHNSDYTNSPTLLAMWQAAKTVPSIKKRTEFHKYRIRQELYNVRQDPHMYMNLVSEAENQERVATMQALLVDWMEETNHPATALMKHPNNQKLIDNYMEYETCNAVEQLDKSRDEKSNSNCPWPDSLSSSSTDSKFIWIGASILALVPLVVIIRILYFRSRSS